MPFSTGARSCIGNKLALTEFKILLAMSIRNFIFQPVEGFRIRKRYVPVSIPDPCVELIVSKVENQQYCDLNKFWIILKMCNFIIIN